MEGEIDNQASKRVASGASIVFIGLFLSKIFGYLYRVYIARYFGPDVYGLFSLGLSIIGFIFTISLLGLTDGITRYVSYFKTQKDLSKVKGVITTSLKLTLPMSLFLSGILFLFAQDISVLLFHKPELTNFIKIMSLSIPFYVVSYLLFGVFRGFQKIKYEVYSFNIFSNLAKVVLVISLGYFTKETYNVAWSWTIAWILTLFLSLYYIERKVFPIFRTPIKSKNLRGELLRFSLPLLLASFVWEFILWTDTLVLGYYKTADIVGFYNAAVPTAILLLTIPIAFNILFTPILTELHTKKKTKEMEKLYKTTTRWVFFINFPFVLAMVIFSKQILALLFTSQYTVGYQALSLLSIGFFVGSLFRSSIFVLEVIKKTKLMFYNTLFAAVLNIVLNFYLIPKYGMVGAATATATSFILLRLLSTIESYQLLKLWPLSYDLLKSFFAGILSIIITYHFGHYVWFYIGPLYVIPLFLVYAVIYSILMVLFNAINDEDKEILFSMKNKLFVS